MHPLGPVLRVAVLDRVREDLAQGHQDPVPGLVREVDVRRAAFRKGAEPFRCSRNGWRETSGLGRWRWMAREELIHFVRFGSKAGRILAERRDVKDSRRAERSLLPSRRWEASTGPRSEASPWPRPSPRRRGLGRDDRASARPNRGGRRAPSKRSAAADSSDRSRRPRSTESSSRRSSGRSSSRASPRRRRTRYATLVALGFIEETPNLIDRLDRLLRLPGDRLLRPGAEAFLSRPRGRRRSASVGGDRRARLDAMRGER